MSKYQIIFNLNDKSTQHLTKYFQMRHITFKHRKKIPQIQKIVNFKTFSFKARHTACTTTFFEPFRFKKFIFHVHRLTRVNLWSHLYCLETWADVIHKNFSDTTEWFYEHSKISIILWGIRYIQHQNIKFWSVLNLYKRLVALKELKYLWNMHDNR